MTFKPGESGNKNGRPAGIPDKRSKLRKLLTPHAEALVEKMVELALSGDVNALRLCIERLIPRIKDEVIHIDFANLDFFNHKHLIQAGSIILQTIADGTISPEQAKSISTVLDAQRKAIDSNILCDRVTEIEHALKIRQPK